MENYTLTDCNSKRPEEYTQAKYNEWATENPNLALKQDYVYWAHDGFTQMACAYAVALFGVLGVLFLFLFQLVLVSVAWSFFKQEAVESVKKTEASSPMGHNMEIEITNVLN